MLIAGAWLRSRSLHHTPKFKEDENVRYCFMRIADEDLSDNQLAWLITQLPQHMRDELFSTIQILQHSPSNVGHNMLPLVGRQSPNLLRSQSRLRVNVACAGND